MYCSKTKQATNDVRRIHALCIRVRHNKQNSYECNKKIKIKISFRINVKHKQTLTFKSKHNQRDIEIEKYGKTGIKKIIIHFLILFNL